MDKINTSKNFLFNRIINIFFILGIIINLTIILGFYIYPKLKYKPYVVLTESMYPIINKGDIIIIKNTDYSINDIVVYMQNDTNMMRKIISIDSNNIYISNDEYIDINNILGKYILRIPILGYFVLFIQSYIGLIIFLISIVIIYILYRRKKIEVLERR